MIHRARETATTRGTIIFVHGLCLGAWCWDQGFMQLFNKYGYDCYAIDLDRAGNPSIQDYVSQLHKVVKELPGEPYIVGHSMGGFVVQKYLEMYSCKGAVLMASVPPSGALYPSLRFLLRHPQEVINLVRGDIRRGVANQWQQLYRPGMDRVMIEQHARHLVPDSFRAFLSMLFQPVRRGCYGSTPILVLGAALDALVSQSEVMATGAFHQTAPQFFEESGHNMMLEMGQKELVDFIYQWLGAQD